MDTMGYGPPYGRVNYGWMGEAWALYAKQPGVWICCVLIVGALQIGIWVVAIGISAPGFFPLLFHGEGGSPLVPDLLTQTTAIAGELVGIVASAFAGAFLNAGLFRMANKVVRGEQIVLGDLLSGGPVFLPLLGYSFLFGIATNLGTRLCLIPGVIVGALWWPGHALIADGETFGSAFQRSMNGMARDFLNAALFTFVWGLILVFSTILTVLLGTLVTIPMSCILAALMCRDMVGPLGTMPPGYGYGPFYPTQGAPGVWPPPPNAQGQGAPPNQGPYSSPPPGQWPPTSPPPAGQWPPTSSPPDPGSPEQTPQAQPPGSVP